MTRMSLPLPEILQAELDESPPPGTHEPSAIQFGCQNCPHSIRALGAWLTIESLVEIIDAQVGVPRAFVCSNFAAIGKATGCEIDEETGEPDCAHAETVRRAAAIIAAAQQP